MQIASPVSTTPPNVAESTNLDAAFQAAWNQVQEMCPVQEDGDYAFKIWAANLAYRYKGGGTYAPTITSLTPNTAVHLVGTSCTIAGTNFDANAVVNFNGTDVTSGAHSPTTIVFAISGSMIPTAATYPVIVRNTDGQITAATNFTAT